MEGHVSRLLCVFVVLGWNPGPRAPATLLAHNAYFTVAITTDFTFRQKSKDLRPGLKHGVLRASKNTSRQGKARRGHPGMGHCHGVSRRDLALEPRRV